MDKYSSDSLYDDMNSDQKRQAEDRLEGLLLEGLDSGPLIEVTDEHIAKTRAELIERIQRNEKRDG